MWKNILILLSSLCVAGLILTRSVHGATYHYEPPARAQLQLPRISNRVGPSQQQQYQGQYQYQQPLQNAASVASLSAHTHAQSVRLPLPLGIPSINIEPLPLQPGVPYTSSHGLTSYGTPYPQRV